jgi:DNA-binding CsgD family transcriptional regulator
MRVRRLSKEQKREIIKMLGQGIPCKTIANSMSISLQTVYYTGWRIGIKGKWGQKERLQRDIQIIKELKRDIACKEIAIHFNISLQTVYRIKWKDVD